MEQQMSEFNLFIGLNVSGDDGEVAFTIRQETAERLVGLMLQDVVKGWTITTGKGCWGGMTEPSIIVTIIAPTVTLITLRDVVRRIKTALIQQTILLTHSVVYAEEI